MNEKEIIRSNIGSLIDEYRRLSKSKTRKEMEELSEATIRADFIDRLFKALRWKINDPDEYDREYSIKKGGRADIVLKINKKPVIFIEAKRFGGIPHINERGDNDWLLEERQAILYAAKEGGRFAILTNFERFRVFNASTGLTILDIESIYDYTDKFEKLLYLTKESVETGKIERLAAKEIKEDIDKEFLDSLKKWRVALANDIYENNKDNNVLKDEKGDIDLDKIKDAVQRILDRLVIIRWAEDRMILEDPIILQRKYDEWKASPIYNSIVDSLFADRALFDKFNDIHNGKIFERGHICEKVKISDKVLGGILNEMLGKSFRKFDFDILGNTYETYLGHTLFLKEDGTLGLKPSQETRKESGIYYTPPYVVDYIVKNTLGELLENKTSEEVKKIKILDPACGSGSFLIKAFDYFKDYYERENERIRKEKEEKIKEFMKSNGNQLNLNIESLKYKEHKEFEQYILKNNIYGVDLDRQAAEIASVNLMLKALKPREKLPPILEETIKVGNSLISGSEDELKKYFGEEWKEKKPFNWKEEFSEIFEEGGFDIVIGNPPYGGLLDGKELAFIKEKYVTGKIKNYDTYALFLENMIKRLPENGYFGFIIPDTFLRKPDFYPLRKLILEYCAVVDLVELGPVFVDAPRTENVILILHRLSSPNERFKAEIHRGILNKEGRREERLNLLKMSKWDREGFISQKYWWNAFQKRLGSYVDEKLINIIAKIEKLSVPLSDIENLEISRGSEGGKGAFTSEARPGYVKILIPDDIDGYSCKYPSRYGEIKDEKLDKYLRDKILIIRIRNEKLKRRVIATFDDRKFYTLKTIQMMSFTKDSPYNLKYILAVLNSKVANFYCTHYLTDDLNKKYLQSIHISPVVDQLGNHIVDQKPFIELVDKMLSLNKQLNQIDINFDHYVNQYPRTKDTTLRYLMNKLPLNDKKVLRDHYGKLTNQIEGKIKEFEIIEEGEWLIFKIGYLFKSRKGKEVLISNVKAFKCRIEDENLRKFLYYCIKEYITPGKLGKGNIYERILKIKIPQFDSNEKENKKIIDEIMDSYLEEVSKSNELKKEIEETDQTIDNMVYELYGLTEEEIKVVEGKRE